MNDQEAIDVTVAGTTETPVSIVDSAKAAMAQAYVQDTVIAVMVSKYMPMTIDGVDDTQGFRAVHEARMVVKGHRVQVDKTRKKLKADALKYGQVVDAEARRITALLTPIEEYLQEQQDAVTAEKARIKDEARLKAEAEEQAKREAEEARLQAIRDAEAARIKAEQERLAVELDEQQAEIETQRAKLADEQAQLAAQKQALADEKDAIERAEELERAKEEAATKARQDAEETQASELQADYDAEEAAKAAEARKEARKPDVDKIMQLATSVRNIALPVCSSKADEALERIKVCIDICADTIEGIAEDI